MVGDQSLMDQMPRSLPAPGAPMSGGAAPMQSLQLPGLKSVVVTGTLNRFSRDEIHRLIEREGGKPAGSVSSRTSYLVAGEAAGSKLEKAKSLGVPVLSEDEFLEMIGEGGKR